MKATAIILAVAVTLGGCGLDSSAAPETRFTLLDGFSRTTADLKGKVTLVRVAQLVAQKLASASAS